MATDPPAVDVEVVHPLADYAEPQLTLARAIHHALDRGKLVLVEPPWSR
jgi:hypothetical protein